MQQVRPSAEDIETLKRIRKLLLMQNRIAAICACTEFAYSLVRKSEPTLCPTTSIFEEAVERFAEQVYQNEKKNLGMDRGLKQ